MKPIPRTSKLPKYSYGMYGNYSSAQRLMERRTKTLISTTLVNPEPKKFFDSNERNKMDVKRTNITSRYTNKKTLNPLSIGQTVRMQPIKTGEKPRKPAEVSKVLKKLAYEIS